ncbi:hypothetical protein QTP86_030472 [Hemibagrus guttatus]|nr:hypothetical protein QTP86_030472 [Hemibagrus guttatus]
MMSQTCLHLR